MKKKKNIVKVFTKPIALFKTSFLLQKTNIYFQMLRINRNAI